MQSSCSNRLNQAEHGCQQEHHRSARMGAILSMELVLVLPIILLLLFAVCEFSMLASAQTQVSDSARNTARLMSISGMPAAEAETAVLKLLGPGLSRGARVRVQAGQFPGDSCQITVFVPMNNATPDLLWMTGFSVKDRFMTGHASMVVEREAAAANLVDGESDVVSDHLKRL